MIISSKIPNQLMKKNLELEMADWEDIINESLTPDEDLANLLHEAVFYGDHETAEFCLRRGADPNTEDDSGRTPLIQAVLRKFPELVRIILGRNPDITRALRSAFLEMVNSISVDPSVDSEILSLILHHGMQYEDSRLSNYYRLCEAVVNDDWKTVYLCISSLQDVDFYDIGAIRPLEIAVGMNRLHVTEILLKRGADPDQNVDFNVESVLLHPIYLDNPGMLMLLLKYDADVNFIDFERYCGWHLTPLATAVLISNNSNLIRILLTYSKGQIDVNGLSMIGNTPETALDLACRLGRLDSVKLLIDYGAPINSLDDNWNTPLHKAVGHLEVVKYLLQNGARANAGNLRKQTPLHWASQARGVDEETVVEIIEALTNYGGDPAATDQEGNTVAEYASTRPAIFIYIVDKILDLGFSINERFSGGRTLLHFIPLTHCNSFTELLKRGADINIRSNYGQYGDHVHTCDCQVGDIVNRLKYIGYQVTDRGMATEIGFMFDEERYEIFREELDILANEVVGWNPIVRLDDLLFKKLNTLEKYAANEGWARVYEACNEDFESAYPLYGGLMNYRYRKVMARRRRINRAKLCLDKVLGLQIPAQLMRRICKYLTDRDLHICIDSLDS